MQKRRLGALGFLWTALLVVLVSFSSFALPACKAAEKTTPVPVPVSSAEPVASVAASAPASAEAPRVAPEPAKAWARPFLWRIEPRTAGGKASYLMGTIHVPDARLKSFPPSVERALSGADSVFTEIELEDGMEAKMMPRLLLPGGKTLEDVLPKALYQRLEALLEEKNLPIAVFAQMKVWVVATQVGMLDRLAAFATMKPLDKMIFARGQSARKEVGGLETIDEQMAVFEGLTSGDQVRLLEQTLDLRAKYRREGKDSIEEILTTFLSGDDAKMRARMTEGMDPSNPLDVKLMKRVFTDRNVVMADRILAKVKASPNKAFFFAVGAGHVVADDGVVALLGKRGLTVVREAE